MWKNKMVQLIFPAYNEEESIKNAIDAFFEVKEIDEIIVVDNNSRDNTKSEILRTRAKYVFEIISGYGAALIRGLKEADADLIITCEPDGTFSAKDILKLLVYSDDFDIVFGTRTSKSCIWDGANMNWFLRLGNIIVAKELEYLFNGPCLTDLGCTMKLIKKEQLNIFLHKLKVQKSHFQPEFMINSIIVSKNVVEIPVNYLKREGISKITGSFSKTLKLGITMICYVFLKRIEEIFTKKRLGFNK